MLKKTALAEGVSFLLLLGVAMPLKYLAGHAWAVLYTGWAHGVLFVALCILLAIVHFRCRWSLFQSGMVFIASLIPFGPFIIDRKLKVFETAEERKND